MSSILDALKKLEADKAAQKAREEQGEEPFDPARAADDLFGAPTAPTVAEAANRDQGAGSGVPKMVFFFGGALVLLMFGVLVAVVVWVTFAVTQLMPAQQEAANQGVNAPAAETRVNDDDAATPNPDISEEVPGERAEDEGAVVEESTSEASVETVESEASPAEEAAPEATTEESPSETPVETTESEASPAEEAAPEATTEESPSETPLETTESETNQIPESPPSASTNHAAEAPAQEAEAPSGNGVGQGPSRTQNVTISAQETPEEDTVPSESVEAETVASGTISNAQEAVRASQEATSQPRESNPKPAPRSPVSTTEPVDAPETSESGSSPENTGRSETISASPSRETRRNNEPLPDNLRTLPLLRNTERNSYGLEELRINMLREPSENRPNALAIVNLNRVYVGERIPDTEARLIGVESRGIAIEIIGSNERYFVEH